MEIWQASRPTVIDLKIWGKKLLNRSFRFPNFGRGWGLRGGFRCFLVVNPSFFCLPAHESLESFHFRSKLPFWVFTLGSCLFIFLFSLIIHYAFENSKFIPNRWVIYQDDFGWKFSKEKRLQSKYPCSIKMDFYRT